MRARAARTRRATCTKLNVPLLLAIVALAAISDIGLLHLYGYLTDENRFRSFCVGVLGFVVLFLAATCAFSCAKTDIRRRALLPHVDLPPSTEMSRALQAPLRMLPRDVLRLVEGYCNTIGCRDTVLVADLLVRRRCAIRATHSTIDMDLPFFLELGTRVRGNFYPRVRVWLGRGKDTAMGPFGMPPVADDTPGRLGIMRVAFRGHARDDLVLAVERFNLLTCRPKPSHDSTYAEGGRLVWDRFIEEMLERAMARSTAVRP